MKSIANRSVRLLLGFVMLSAFSGSCTADGLTLLIEVSRTTTSVSGPSKDVKSAFVESRLAAIRYDAARGYGENLDTLATLLGEADRIEFARWMKTHYSDLFVGLNAPSELLGRIETQRSRG